MAVGDGVCGDRPVRPLWVEKKGRKDVVGVAREKAVVVEVGHCGGVGSPTRTVEAASRQLATSASGLWVWPR